MFASLYAKVNRTKKLDYDEMMETPLKRCLTTFDICFLGIGQMIGASIYVILGTTAKNIAGPGVIISFLIAGLAASLAAICYAEFGARVPRTGSAYAYTYISVGEFWSFIVGWNIVLEYSVSTAAMARAWGDYLDSFFGGAIHKNIKFYVGDIELGFFTSDPDFIASITCLIVGGCLFVKVKTACQVNDVLTMFHMCVVIFVTCCGMYWADIKNWTHVPGGFFPFGFNGVIAGAGACYFAFIGFDAIAAAGEETERPHRSIPVATFVSVGVVVVAYVLISVTLTLMVPYNVINSNSALPEAFEFNNAAWAKYITAAGALFGIPSALFGTLFSLQRCLYAMSVDGLFFEVFSKVDPKQQVPVINVMICAIFTSFIALLFEIEKLVELVSIGLLSACTFVDACVIILRYQPASSYTLYSFTLSGITESNESLFKGVDMAGSLKPSFRFLRSHLDYAPGFVVKISVIIMTLFLVAVCAVIKLAYQELSQATWWAVLLVIFFFGLALGCLFIICVHEQCTQTLSFKVPFVPLLPALSIFINLMLMIHLNYMTWIRFAVGLLIGIVVYFGYGIRNSKENESEDQAALLATTDAPETLLGYGARRFTSFDEN